MTGLSNLPIEDLKAFLDEKVEKYNHPSFIESDPVSIPHLFTRKQDIEISGFLAATIAWGQRVTIIKKSKKLVELMDYSPFDFINNAQEKDFLKFESFVHRTFNGEDCIFFLKSLQNLYKTSESLEDYFFSYKGVKNGIINFRKAFFETTHLKRSEKHVSNPDKKSSAKRLNMFLRWMVRKDKKGVDFGIWDKIPSSELFMPLDVHTANVGRKLSFIKRKQNDWQTVEELTTALKKLDCKDPIKYDFALFGLGIFENF